MKILILFCLCLSACAKKSNDSTPPMKFRVGPACIQNTTGGIYCFHQSNIEQVYGP